MSAHSRGHGESTSAILGAGIAGGLLAAFWYVEDLPFRAGELVGLLFASAAIMPLIALQLPLRHARSAKSVAGMAAWATVCGFFGVTFALTRAPLPRETLLIFLGVAPIVTAIIAFVGAAFLARGVRRARARRVPE